MLKALQFIFYTELLLRLRRSQDWVYPLGFFVIVMSLFPLAFSPDPLFLKQYMPGCVWIAALFANLLAMGNVFLADREEGHLEQLLISPLPLTFILTTKLFVQWLVTTLPLILLIPFLGIMFHFSSHATLMLCLTLLLGTPILTLLSSLMVALTQGLKQQGVFLGLLLLPLATPILIFGINIVEQSETTLSTVGPLAFLAGLLVLSVLFLPWAAGAALRIVVE